MNILFITICLHDLWFLIYREYPYSVTFPCIYIYICYYVCNLTIYPIWYRITFAVILCIFTIKQWRYHSTHVFTSLTAYVNTCTRVSPHAYRYIYI